jgi:TatD DNase family protein
MLVDTHCHINIMVKDTFDTPLTEDTIAAARTIIDEAAAHGVTTIINVGTSVIESHNCIALAQRYQPLWATVGIHPNDLTATWRDDIKQLHTWVQKKEQNKIVGIGEIGLDFHYPDYNVSRQIDAFRAQIELALEHGLSIVVHSRKAPDQTLRVLEEYTSDNLRGIIHCFSENQDFADVALRLGFVLGIGGTVTYPNNVQVRSVVEHTPTEKLVLETDAPYLPPQIIRGKKNHPLHIATIARYISEVQKVSFEQVAAQTTQTAFEIFGITRHMEMLNH